MNPIMGAPSHVTGWWLRLPMPVRDAALAVLVAVYPVANVLADRRDLDAGRWVGWLLFVLATCATLSCRRRFPLSVAVAAAVLATAAALVSGRDVVFLVVAAAFGSAAYHVPGRSPLLVGAGLVWSFGFASIGRAAFDLYSTAMIIGLAIAPVALGYALRMQGERGADMARVERARADAFRAEERTRIARDVHDVVGHHLSAIRLQAVGGRRRPADADRTLQTIADLSQRALGDIRDLLEDLRHDADPVHELADLPALLAQLRGPDLRIDLTETAGKDIGPAVGSCAYRVVQESLTNVVRHSRARSAAVHIARDGELFVITVDDGGPHGDAAPDGNGLLGMRERVTRLGGTFSAGEDGGGGWRVRAVLPVVRP